MLVSLFLEFKSSSLHVLYMFRTEENKKMKPSQGKITISLKVPKFFFFWWARGLGSALDHHSPCLLQCKLKKKKKNHYYFWSKSKFPTRVFFLRILSILTHIHGERGKCFLKKLTVMYIQKSLNLEYTLQEIVLAI